MPTAAQPEPSPDLGAITRRRRWVAQRGSRPQWRRGLVRPSSTRRRPVIVAAGGGGASAGQRQRGSRLLHRLGDFSAHAAAGLLAAGAVLAWLAVGLVTAFPGWWETVLYSVSSSITLVMVFAIQHTQARQQSATQRKLDELLRAQPSADNRLIAVEEAPDAELEALADLNLADREQADSPLPG
jgi:low affinity Fe/Cu permease